MDANDLFEVFFIQNIELFQGGKVWECAVCPVMMTAE